jgi:poly(3-hydroxyoctanoate) depolymerase
MFAASSRRSFQLAGLLVAALAAGAGCGRPGTDPLGEPEDLSSAAQGLASLCTATDLSVSCPHQKLTLSAAGLWRDVHYQLPAGTPPPGGWPVVIFFQGSFMPAVKAFSALRTDAFGGYSLALTTKALLDAGYAVVAPNALLDGTTYWQTNIPPYDLLWTSSADHAFMQAIFPAISGGSFGPLNANRLYATGISSGGFMSSRMAVSYRGRFRALAVHSGSYATCSALCTVPRPLPSDHPPTLFLHGALDTVVPIATMRLYRDALVQEGHATQTVVNAFAGHQWLPEGPQAIPAWFNANP